MERSEDRATGLDDEDDEFEDDGDLEQSPRHLRRVLPKD
jgi:hypothetical protein